LALAYFGGEPIQAGVPGAAPRPTGYCARIAILQLFALLCVATALGCALAALWIDAAPTLGGAGALLMVSKFFMRLSSPRSS
jgi:hypothetical protein